ncbi:FAD-dependent oxidoreductase [Synechococcus sp. CS-1324]|uniref:FAD-dependent oxidoreductase n=1 Tax=Synechococcus sp. CS-1324 TaxID=2847980 RepID=UPI000DB809C0|nr:FAD-dependent oxidoreductase [Synechococcus sp. CS-1324]MCT0230325.1 FAD-dependent oxidoreductase [Synechococcus sp. CS-1324]PZV03968.1 MAG: amino acid oxidase [Cyanobium sp.]
MDALAADSLTAPFSAESFDSGAAAVLILGGGLIGLAIAHQLARRGQSVLVLSRRRSEAAGFVAAGMLAPHAEGLSGPLLDLGQRSLGSIPGWVAQIEADSGLSCGFRPCGIVVPFRSAAERDAYPTARFGLALDAADLRHEIGGIGAAWQAGLLFDQDGQIDNRRQLMRALETACVALGVGFQEGSEVLELLAPAGRLEAIRLRRTEGEVVTLPCRRAVLACGAWSARLLPGLPVQPIKGQMLSLQAPRQALKRVLFGPGTYLVPREDGLLVVGATSEPDAGFAAGLTPQGQSQLEQGLVSLLPEAAHWPPMERWWGFRPGTPDGLPLLGPAEIAGLWLATGHYRNGVLLAAISASLIANLIEPGASGDAALLAPFDARRFGRPAPGDQLGRATGLGSASATV